MYIRQTLMLYSLVIIAMLVGTGVFALKLAQQFTDLQAITRREHILLGFAEELRVSSLSLTRSAREFIITGNPNSAQEYFTTLAIRNGEKPRNSTSQIEQGKKIALIDLLAQYGATEEELNIFAETKALSDELAKLEIEAIQLKKKGTRDRLGNYVLTSQLDRAYVTALLFNEDYQKRSQEIIAMVGTFSETLIARSTMESRTEAERLQKNLYIIFCFIIVILFAALGSAWYGFKKISQPLTLTMDFAKNIDKGNLAFNINIQSNNEIGQLCRVLNNMVNTLKKNTETLKKLSYSDDLTRLYNRRRFQELLQERFQLVQRNRLKLALAMFDLDHFKRINDTYGHPVGDIVLRAFADMLRHSVRKTDIVARFGGEEFVLVLDGVDQDAALRLVESIREKCTTLVIDYNNVKILFTVSIGVCTYDAAVDEPIDTEILIERADKALYQAKAQGRNQVALWNKNICFS